MPTPAGIPNNVGAQGFGAGDCHFHAYQYDTKSGLSLEAAGNGLKRNPTPGNDSPATPEGTVNDVGAIPSAESVNKVRNSVVPSPDPTKYSEIIINYTIAGQHRLAEGFVMRFGSANGDGSTLTSYGERNNWRQNELLHSWFGLGWGS